LQNLTVKNLRGESKNMQRTKQTKRMFYLGPLLTGMLSLAGATWAIEVGDKAPDFKLPATTGVDIALGDFKGKKFVLLEFYGAAFVPA
jgi:hypothetical protein